VDPQKKWTLRIVTQPRDGATIDLSAIALGDGRARVTRDHGTKASVIGLEATVEALRRSVRRIEVDRASKGSRAIALRLQQIGKKGQRGR